MTLLVGFPYIAQPHATPLRVRRVRRPQVQQKSEPSECLKLLQQPAPLPRRKLPPTAAKTASAN
jgi:hypothetical protein